MSKSHVLTLVIYVLFLFPIFYGALIINAKETKNGSEIWGYTEVRTRTYMFWWHYKSQFRVSNANFSWPLILWLQGGPGDSGVGLGNFKEIGPLDEELKPRAATWLNIADVLFVDSPIRTGYSYTWDRDLYVKNDIDAATDLITLLTDVLNKTTTTSINRSLYIVGESYGGRFAVTLGLKVLEAFPDGKLKYDDKFGGVILKDSLISPDDCGVAQYKALPEDQTLSVLMNRVDKNWGKLDIIPYLIDWYPQKYSVFNAMSGDFNISRIDEVLRLLINGVNVFILTGDEPDSVCSIEKTDAWVQKLEWPELGIFNKANQTQFPYDCGNDVTLKSYKNLHIYRIKYTGSVENKACAVLNVVANITSTHRDSH